MKPLVRGLAVAVVLASGPGVAEAQNACDAGKLKCIRQYVGCLVKVHEASQKKGLPPDAAKLQRCVDKLDGGIAPAKGCFATLEAKADAACSTSGNVGAIEAQVDQDVQGYLAALAVVVPTTTSTSTATMPSPTTSTTMTPSTTTTTTTGPACGGTVCGGSCPNSGTCLQDPLSLLCDCTPSECDEVYDPAYPLPGCIGNCGISGGSCKCDSGGMCVGAACSSSSTCPVGDSCFLGFCLGPQACESSGECPAGYICAPLCAGSCVCQP